MIRLYRSSDLPPDIPGMIVSDGEDAAVLISTQHSAGKPPAWTRALANSLLARLNDTQSNVHIGA